MAISGGRTFQRTHRLEENTFKVDPSNPRDMQAVANADRAVMQGDDDRGVSIMYMNRAVQVIDTTEAEIPDERTVEMEKGRKVVTVPVSLIKSYQKDKWKLC